MNRQADGQIEKQTYIQTHTHTHTHTHTQRERERERERERDRELYVVDSRSVQLVPRSLIKKDKCRV